MLSDELGCGAAGGGQVRLVCANERVIGADQQEGVRRYLKEGREVRAVMHGQVTSDSEFGSGRRVCRAFQ